MDIESKLALEEHEPAVIAFLADNDGSMEKDGAVEGQYWLTLRPRSAPQERFYVCLRWTVYPHRAASVRFADAIGGPFGMHAWPAIPGYRAPNDICKPFTAEGFAAHTEWVWQTTGNPFLWTVTVLQDDLDTKYTGRAG